MSPRLKYVLFRGKFGYVLLAGVIVTGIMLTNNAVAAATVAAVIAAVAAVGTYLKVDRPIVNAMPTNE